MNPLTLSTGTGKSPQEFGELLDILTSRPQPAVVHYDASTGDRVELSGRVLANWAVKLIGLFSEEVDLTPQDQVLIDMAPHWKACAMALAAGAMSAEVLLLSEDEKRIAEAKPTLVVTDRPSAWLEADKLGEAELAAVSHGMLDTSFEEATGEQIPAWVLDVSADVRQQPDQLTYVLPQASLPSRLPEPRGSTLFTHWAPESFAKLVGIWSRSGVVVLFQGSSKNPLWEQMLVNEGLD